MKNHRLEKTVVIQRPLSEVFAFFSKAENLNKITPPELNFTITTPLPIDMKPGTLIDYRIRLNGIPFNWKTRISTWNPPHEFVDEQLKGPYVTWHHTHRFRALDNGYTEMTDIVLYQSPGWIFEPIIHHLYVKKRVEAIFDYREKILHELFS